MSVIRFALVGCGRVADRHVKAVSDVAGAEIVAVCDVDEPAARAMASRLGVPWFTGVEGLLRADLGIDVVNVLTPTGCHAEHAIAVAHSGRHVVVEKPMTLLPAQADRMIVACEDAGVRLFVVKQNRYNPPIQALKMAMDAGRFGKPVLAAVRLRWCREQSYYDQADWRGTRAMDGGVLANQASHHIDLMVWMMGPVRSVHAYTATRLVDVEVEDTAVVTLRFVSGALGLIEATTATRPSGLEASLSILGETGAAEVGGYAVNEMRVWQFTEPHPDDASVLAQPRSDDRGFGHRAFVADVVECLRSGGPAPVDGLEGRKSIELIAAIYESAATGREVALQRPDPITPDAASG